MTNKIILTDVDGVLLDWNTAFAEHMARLCVYELPDQRNRYSLCKRFGLQREVIDKFASEYNSSKNIENLKPFKDSVEHVKALSAMGYRFIAITNVGASEESRVYRVSNLFNVFGDVFDDVICLDIGASKYSVLSKWENTGLFWIEDKFTNALDGHSLGLQSILVDHEYNRDFSTTRFPRVSNDTPWKEICDLIFPV